MAIKQSGHNHVNNDQRHPFRHPRLHPIFQFNKFKLTTKFKVSQRVEKLDKNEVDPNQGNAQLKLMLKLIGFIILLGAFLLVMDFL